MRARLSGPTIDASDPRTLAAFYAQLLGWAVVDEGGPRPGNPPEDAWVKIASPDGSAKIEFQWDPNHRPPVWPSEPGAQQMQMHLDIAVEDLDAGVAHALELGATVADHQVRPSVRVMLDPAGHPFCLFAGRV